MLRNMLLSLLGRAWILLLIGLGLLAYGGYTIFNAEQGGGISPEAELTPVAAKITEANEVTVEKKRRRGGKSVHRYYELTAQLADGTSQKWRVDHAISQSAVEHAIDENVQAKVDGNDNNLVYVLAAGGQNLIAYADMARIAKAQAESDKASFASMGMLGFDVLAIALGGLGIWLRRRMLRADRAAEAAASAAV